jgi:hypothetical protein
MPTNATFREHRAVLKSPWPGFALARAGAEPCVDARHPQSIDAGHRVGRCFPIRADGRLGNGGGSMIQVETFAREVPV